MVRAGQWVTVPAGDDRQVATVLAVETGALLVERQDDRQVRRVPLYLVTTPSGRPVDDTAGQLRPVRAA